MILEIVTVGSIISAAAAGYIAYVQYKKNEEYERAIVEFYSAVALVLHTMRIIDEKKMFEEDDEVGSVFQQLVELVNELRPIAYGIENADRPTKE
jgi:hypothetical protein